MVIAALLLGLFTADLLSLRPDDSGGPLVYEQAAYDLREVALHLQVFPAQKRIGGMAHLTVRVVQPTHRLRFDLDNRLEVSQVLAAMRPLAYDHHDGVLMVNLARTYQSGEQLSIAVHYGGQPREAPRPPWVGGFTWSSTADGQPWIGVSCQLDGADLWWPTKDHPSDEPERVSLHIRVPQSLKVAANGLLLGIDRHDDQTHTFNWRTELPINSYNVTLNIAPYRLLESSYTSVDGTVVPLQFWALPEHYEQAWPFLNEIQAHLRFYEETLGPYPFRAEKYGVAETPYLGMEHQTIIAYGHGFQGGKFGYDWLHHHELGHEWWGNLVTVSDWRDFWIHEGLCGYMQALYNEAVADEAAYHAFFEDHKRSFPDHMPLAPVEPQTLVAVYNTPPDYTASSGIVWTKGALMLHSLRYLLGRDVLVQGLRRFAYPNEAAEKRLDGSATRFVTSADFVATMEQVSGQELGWFFQMYLRQVDLPELVQERKGDRLALYWRTNQPFPMPIDIQVGEKTMRLALTNEPTYVSVKEDVPIIVDPKGWVLRQADTANPPAVQP